MRERVRTSSAIMAALLVIFCMVVHTTVAFKLRANKRNSLEMQLDAKERINVAMTTTADYFHLAHNPSDDDFEESIYTIFEKNTEKLVSIKRDHLGAADALTNPSHFAVYEEYVGTTTLAIDAILKGVVKQIGIPKVGDPPKEKYEWSLVVAGSAARRETLTVSDIDITVIVTKKQDGTPEAKAMGDFSAEDATQYGVVNVIGQIKDIWNDLRTYEGLPGGDALAVDELKGQMSIFDNLESMSAKVCVRTEESPDNCDNFYRGMVRHRQPVQKNGVLTHPTGQAYDPSGTGNADWMEDREDMEIPALPSIEQQMSDFLRTPPTPNSGDPTVLDLALDAYVIGPHAGWFTKGLVQNALDVDRSAHVEHVCKKWLEKLGGGGEVKVKDKYIRGITLFAAEAASYVTFLRQTDDAAARKVHPGTTLDRIAYILNYVRDKGADASTFAAQTEKIKLMLYSALMWNEEAGIAGFAHTHPASGRIQAQGAELQSGFGEIGTFLCGDAGGSVLRHLIPSGDDQTPATTT